MDVAKNIKVEGFRSNCYFANLMTTCYRSNHTITEDGLIIF